MKTLILYASAGAGHKKAAEAIYTELKNKNPQEKVELVDIVNFATPFFKFSYTTLYEFLITKVRLLWGILFFLSNQPALFIFNKGLRFLSDKFNLRRLIKHIEELKPELIISTHFLSSELVIYLKEKGRINSKIVSVVTDFGVHFIWGKSGADKYTTATEKTKEELARFGVQEELIEVLGIPVREQFFRQLDKNSLKQKFNIKEGFTALIMTGAIGAGPIEQIVESLYREINVIVVCGNNKHLFDRLQSKDYSSVKVLGFVDNIDEYMAASDVLITKAGGLTISEAITKNLPMVFFFLVPGQETNNARIMQELGAGRITRNIPEIKNFVLEFKDDPEKSRQIHDNIRRINRINISDFVEKITTV